jgi:hypothetical protein
MADVSEAHIAPIISVMMEAIRSSETSVLSRATLHNIQEDGILHSHRHESLKSYETIIVVVGQSVV